MGLKNDDKVIDVKLTDNNQGIILTTKAGYGALYSEQEVSVVGIKAAGIKAINLKNDELISLNIFDPMTSCSLMVISENGGINESKLVILHHVIEQPRERYCIKILKAKSFMSKKLLLSIINSK